MRLKNRTEDEAQEDHYDIAEAEREQEKLKEVVEEQAIRLKDRDAHREALIQRLEVTVKRLTAENQSLKATMKKNEQIAKNLDSQGMN